MGESCDSPRLPQRIKRLYLRQSRAIDETLKTHGLARSQWQVLSHVRRTGSLTQRELQELLQVEPATLTGIIDGLAAKGWLERSECAEDKRKRVVRLTAEGERRWADIPDVVDLVEARMVEGVSERDLRVVERVVERMTKNLGRQDR